MDEQECHVRVSHPPGIVGQVGSTSSQQEPLQVSNDPQTGFGDILMNSEFLPSGSGHGNGDGNGSGSGMRGWTSGDANNKNLLSGMTMNHSHLLTDPSIQETLSPFFQPFGVDVSHLPMTNPPIFQSSLTRYDEPVRRRRISISNGQISQLGEDLETVENLYNTQPPPLPQRFDHQQVKNQFYDSGSAADNSKNSMIHMSENENLPSVPFNSSSLATIPPWTNHVTVKEEKPLEGLISQENHENSGPTSSSGIPSAHPMNGMSRVPSSSSSVSSSGHSSLVTKHHRNDPIPGTNAWKRARLLERNRIAASKCRQRKKIAQLQLQKDFDILTEENRIIKKKLDYYEKLVSKFKKFSEAHLKKCPGNENDSFNIIEEMLMIDSDVREVDDYGLVVKIEENQ